MKKSVPCFLGTLCALLLCVGSLCIFQSCGGKKEANFMVNPEFAKYVMSFTSGIVSNQSKIQVRFVQEIPGAEAGKELNRNPFDIEPGVKGKAVWLDAQTIEFTPAQALSSGQIYVVSMNLQKFIEVPQDLKTFVFSFQVINQAMSYEFEGISPYSETDVQWQRIHGSFTTADFVPAEAMESAVEAEKYTMTWKHSADGKTHTFTIDSVERKQAARTIRLEWNGKKINAKNSSGREDISMPALHEFKVLGVRQKNMPKLTLEVFFSDPLNKQQDMAGLFSLSPSMNESVVIDGTKVHIIPTKWVSGEVKLRVHAGVQNAQAKRLNADFTHTFTFVSVMPQVELLDDGVIVPDVDGIKLHFRAQSLSAVDVRIIQIYENNIVQFLQVNQIDGTEELQRVGRLVYSAEMPLVATGEVDNNIYALDLSKLVKTEPGAIYRVELSLRKKHSLYPCLSSDASDEEEEQEENHDPYAIFNDARGYYYWSSHTYYNNYNWNERNDPCKPSYYMNKSVSRNVLASNFGIIAKAGSNGEFFIAVTDVRTAKPLKGVEVELRNLQNQVIASAHTDADGMCRMQTTDQNKAFVVIAKKDKERGYLKVAEGSSLSLSMFDVQGEQLKKGVKGYIYGERGVWRPGDMMYLTFILEDKNKSLPANHPVVFEFYNPEGQLAQRVVRSNSLNGFYSVAVRTPGDAPTGDWTMQARVGGSVFSRVLRIETVKPNRLKINLDFQSSILRYNVTETGTLQVNWLHGAPARKLKASIEASIAPMKTTFKDCKGYIFDDPAKTFETRDIEVFSGTLDDNGKTPISVKFNIDGESNAPGMLAVQMKTKVFESGGDFSIDRAMLTYSPFNTYVGVKIPEGQGWNKALYSDEKNLIPIALVDEKGKPMNGKVTIEIFDIYWRWWWERSAEDNLADYVSNRNSSLIKSDEIEVRNGEALYEMNLDGNYWGRKLIRITSKESGHSTGAVFYTTYRSWYSNAGSNNPGGAEMLMFSTDKTTYSVGEKAKIELPITHSGRALISIENGSKVLKTYWFEPSEQNTTFEFELTPEMTPNVYVHISYIQAHSNDNNYPLRMYGVQSISVEDPATHITPLITMKNELKPEEQFSVTVKETEGKPMTYTIAIVDEGLLDLTRFSTPNPWSAFYNHEALGVRTWDMYKFVAGAFTGKLAGLLAIGGDAAFDTNGKENTNRFKPVVLFQGPFALKKGETKTHSFTMPNYVGSVRVMVVAGENGAYGNAEKTVPVRQSLMVLPTIPRVISPTETMTIPVTVFAMDKAVKTVKVDLNIDKQFEALDGTSRTVTFDKPGDKMVEFTVRAQARIGEGKIIVNAVSGTHKASAETDLKVRVPNPPVTAITSVLVKPGETWSHRVESMGFVGTNRAVIELSRMYPINLEKRLQYLIRYPHGCIEQITSAVFPQLFLSYVMDLTDKQKTEVETNVNAWLEKLKSYQNTNGGFTYWAGEGAANEWGSNYVGHCMLEAQAKGYQLPVGVFDAWVSYQTSQANNWSSYTDRYGRYSDDLNQAYRLYTLALAKKPAMSAMNRMRETQGISNEAKWRLAAAYATVGKPDIANAIMKSIDKTDNGHEYYYETYGSTERDDAMNIETLIALNRKKDAEALVIDLAKVLASNEWLSTQTTAYSLLAISKFVGGSDNSEISATLTIDNASKPITTKRAIYQSRIDMNTSARKQVSVTNTSKHDLYVRLLSEGVPPMKAQPAEAENLHMTVQYFDMKGKPLNPAAIKQGTEFYAEVTVTHAGVRSNYSNMALEQLFPSGWEIMNSRMDNIQNSLFAKTDTPRYMDVRDDRVYMYFDLNKGESKVFRVLLQAAYLGKFFMPPVYCHAMYDNTIRAQSEGKWVEVVR
ncbi:MAG: hypothetical protein LBM68_00765 [Bacteroidales bacterium]|jgi:uncharacterized protein YfaS (alpha-2-macroglobulin family)|nr:hypothetical protein [Bacteroidales bacterium]